VRSLLVVIVILLYGCAPAIPPGATMIQQVEIPARLVHSGAVVPSNHHQLPERWWQRFHDAELNRLVELALQNNPSLQEAEDRVQIAQSMMAVSESLNLPHIDSYAQVVRLKLSKNGANDIYNGATAEISNINPLMIDYHLDFWNHDGEVIAASQSNLQKEVSQAQQSALLLSSSVIKTYCALSTAQKMIAVQQEIVQSAQNEWALQQTAYQTGIQSILPQLKQHTLVLHEQELLAGLQKHAEALQFTLTELLGKLSNSDDKAVIDSIRVPEHFELPQRIDFDLLVHRPDVQAALWNVKQWQHLEKVAQLNFYPNVNISALVGFNTLFNTFNLARMLDANSFQYGVGPAIDLPLFEGGALEAQLHGKEAGYDLAVHTYNKTVLSAVRQITEALSALQYTQTQLKDSSDTLQIRRNSMLVAKRAFESGVDGKSSYLESQIDMNQAQLHDLEENLEWLNDMTDAATSLGGGFGGKQS